VASTRSRPHGREHARPSTGGVAAEHATKIYAVALVGIVVIVAFLALTGIGHVIDAATQHFMLFYAGVFALIGLCASVGLGLVATDRMFLHPGQRVYIQAAHRAASFGALAFLIIHIVTEILAQRVHVIDAFVPFLSPFRTFYIGLGTIASDLVILLVITSIVRGRFNGRGKAWSWRAIHYTSYLCLVFGVWHGLLGGRPGKPYVDWSYGFVVAFVLLGLAIRVLSNSLRPKESLSAPPVDPSASSASAPLRAAAMLAQYGATRGGGRTAVLGASTGAQPMLSAPVSATVLTALPAGGPMAEQGQPYYEPGYEGPPRYLGAPRSEGTGPMPRVTGPMPRAATGSMPRAATGSMPRVTGPVRPAGPPSVSGPMPRAATGPMPRPATGPMPRPATGPLPRAATGSFPAAPARPQSWPGTGPLPRAATGPMPQADGGWGTGPHPRPAPGPVPPGPGPRGAADPRPRGGTGPMPTGSGPYQRPPTGPMPQPGGPMPPPAYPNGAGDGRPGRQEWLETSHDSGWYEQPPWEEEFPDSTDPGFRYREPGPGMPGYRGSRDHRYGGDRY
jgi:DMSO/TMAO reductase YedYZ heme-binding membrane subunit